MGLILTATAGLCLWIILWALNVSGFDGILIARPDGADRDRGQEPAPVPARPAGVAESEARCAAAGRAGGRRCAAALTTGRLAARAPPQLDGHGAGTHADDLRERAARARRRPRTQDVLDAEQLAFTQLPAQTVQPFTMPLRACLRQQAVGQRPHGDPGHERDRLPRRDRPRGLGRHDRDHQRPGSAPGQPDRHGARADPGHAGGPGRARHYYESSRTYGRTFARVVPTRRREAKAQVARMRSLGVKRLYVADDGSRLRPGARVRRQAGRGRRWRAVTPSRRVRGAGATRVFYGGGSPARQRALFDRWRRHARRKLFAPSALADQRFAASLAPAARASTSPARVSAQATCGGRAQAASPAVQSRLRPRAGARGDLRLRGDGGRAGGAARGRLAANNRATVVHDFFAIRNRLGARHLLDRLQRRHQPRAVRVQPRARAGSSSRSRPCVRSAAAAALASIAGRGRWRARRLRLRGRRRRADQHRRQRR